MSGKSIILSILSVLLFVGVVFATVFMFKTSILLGILGIVLLIIPEIVRRKALSKSSGFLDKILAKFVVPVLFVVLTFIAIMAIGFWIDL